MKRRVLFAVAFGIYAVTLIVEAPATLLDAALKAAGNERLRLVQSRGSLWSGSGILEIRNSAKTDALAKPISWRVLPASLWRGRLLCEVRFDATSPPFPVAISPSDIRIDRAELALPAAALALAEPRLKPLNLRGDILVRSDGLSVGDNRMNGKVVLLWQSAGSDFSPVSPFGSYQFQLTGEGGMLQALLTTLEGPLQLDGNGSWKTGATPQFTATARVPPEYKDQFAPLLRLISEQRDDATFELRLR